MKLDLGKIFFLILFLTLSVMAATAGTIKGTITDRQTKEPLTGATVQVSRTVQGAVADLDGNYTLELKNGTYTLTVRYIGYKDMTIKAVEIKGETVLNFDMEPDTQTLGEVQVTAKKNLEGERALQMERQKATLAIENLGSKEMSLKGIGNVEEGVKKITGISIASAGQLIVRGLGDRYSTTTLNGLPIASPNPDNKLVPLDLFPSSTVQNITVSKVYDAAAFADYSGAHINISTKENIPEDFFQLSLNTGGKFNTLGKDRYQMDRSGSLLKTPGVDAAALDMPLMEFDKYVKTHNIFDTSFAASKKSSLPELGGNLGFGKNFGIGNQTLSLLASFSASNGYQNMEDAFYKTLEATGTVQDDFSYDSFAQELKLAALGYLGYTLRRSDRIGYTFFYARNAIDTYQRREGTDAEGHELTGSNNIMHIYTLQNHQLNGIHNFGESDRWQLTWGGSYSKTGSEEPDRRQVMYVRDNDGSLRLFKLNRQETMRYFGSLDEEEWNANLAMRWKWNDTSHLKLGFNYKDKNRDYSATRFYYNLNKLNPVITDTAITDYFQQKNYETEGNNLDAGKTTYFLRLITAIVMGVGLFISILSFYILMLSIFLLLQKNTVKLENLLLIGYSPTQVATPYYILTVGLNVLVLLLAIGCVAWVRSYYIEVVQSLFPQLESGSLLPCILIGCLLFFAVSLLNILAIGKKIISIWKGRK